MYSKELENLISSSFHKWKLEEKSKEALLRRAQKEGIDMDEFEIYLNSIARKKRDEWMRSKLIEVSMRRKNESSLAEDPVQLKIKSIINESIEENLYPKEVLLLLKNYLADGVLTDKERLSLLNKADSLGVNRNEFELFLEAQMQKLEQINNSAERKRKGGSCPFCGAPVLQLTDKCPECGQFITPEATAELEDIINNLEDALVDFKSGYNADKSKAIIERYSRKAKLYYSNHPKIKVLLAEVESEKRETEKELSSKARKEAVVRTLKNKWFWASVPFIIAAILFIISLCIDSTNKTEGTIGTLQMVSGILALIGFYGLFFAGKEYLDKGMETNIEIMEKYKNLFK